MLEEIFEDEGLHAMQVLSLANAVAGTLGAARAGIRAIGTAYAELSGIDEKHATKQVDRLLSNSALRVDELCAAWTRYVVGDAKDIVVALDWTDFDDDDHTTLYVALVTTKGRALPLLWKTLQKSKLKGRQTATEVELLGALHASLAKDVAITVLADRGFAKAEVYETLEVLGIDYVIRIKRDMVVTDSDDARATAQELVTPNGRVRTLAGARVTAKRREVPLFVCVKAKKMKEPCASRRLGDRFFSTLLEPRPAAARGAPDRKNREPVTGRLVPVVEMVMRAGQEHSPDGARAMLRVHDAESRRLAQQLLGLLELFEEESARGWPVLQPPRLDPFDLPACSFRDLEVHSCCRSAARTREKSSVSPVSDSAIEASISRPSAARSASSSSSLSTRTTCTSAPSGRFVGSSSTRRPPLTWALSACIAILSLLRLGCRRHRWGGDRCAPGLPLTAPDRARARGARRTPRGSLAAAAPARSDA
jgi:hypothetical protein